MIDNLLRSTVCRPIDFMVTLWVTLIRPLIKYGGFIWNVGYKAFRLVIRSSFVFASINCYWLK